MYKCLREEKRIFISFILILILFTGSFSNIYAVSSTSYSRIQYTSPTVATSYSVSDSSMFWGQLENAETCNAYNDLMIQIAPLGCSPLIVRSDLLEDQNVPVFCRLEGLRINPAIDISSIRRINFQSNSNGSDDISKYISGIGFHPARAALQRSGVLTGSPISGDLGYVVLVLKQIPAEKDIPDFISGNLTATINYDAENAFGIGVGEMYVPVLSSSEWSANYQDYGFWRGKGYLRAEAISEDSARIVIYGDEDSRISSFELTKGESSERVFLPGGYCRAAIGVTLKDVTYPKTTARLRIGDDEIDVFEGQRFLENKCRVSDISSLGGGSGKVTLSCSDGNLDLELVEPDVELKIQGQAETKTVSIGDQVEGNTLIYSGVIGEGSSEQRFIIFKSGEISETLVNYFRGKIAKVIKDFDEKKGFSELKTKIKESVNKDLVIISKGESDLDNKINFFDVSGVVDKNVAGKNDEENLKIEDSITNTVNAYKEVDRQYGSETIGERKAGELALASAIEFLGSNGLEKEYQKRELMKEYVEKYPKGPEALEYSLELQKTNLYDSEKTIGFTTLNYEPVRIQLMSINEPGFEEIGAKVILSSLTGDAEPKVVSAGINDLIYGAAEANREYIKVVDINEDEVKVKAFVLEETTSGTKTRVEKSYSIKKGQSEIIGDQEVFIDSINFNKVALVSLNPQTKWNEQEVSFPFSIGIEKRAISLSTDEMENNVNWANETIANLQDLSEKIAKAVETMKTICLTTRIVMNLKDMIAGGDATDARRQVMRGISGQAGWFAKCEYYVETKTSEPGQGPYANVDDCLQKNNDKINQEVKLTEKAIQDYKEKRAEFSKALGISTDTALEVYNSGIEKLQEEFGASSIVVGPSNDRIVLKDVINKLSASDLNEGTVTEKDIDDIIRYSSLIKTTGSEEASEGLYTVLLGIQTQRNEKGINSDFEKGILGVAGGRVSYFSSKADSPTSGIPYESLKFRDLKNLKTTDETNKIDGNTPIVLVTVGTSSYLILLDRKNDETRNYFATNYYEIKQEDGQYALSLSSNPVRTVLYKTYESGYYNTPLKGVPKVIYGFADVPKIVPFDRQSGWYAEVNEKYIGQCVKESGTIDCLYLGNAGEDGIIGTGDDEKLSFNINQGYVQFPGLSLSETKKLIEYAKESIRQAILQKEKDSVVLSKPRRDEFPIDKFKTATSDGDLQCQDFMSPKQCQLLFNVCDPVVCPSSRCDLGGTVHVDNVIQSGIIGSLVLCLPNFKSGVILPVCLTGIHAGLEGWMSILENYASCNQEALDNGRNVGICDEIKSFYVCDFFVGQLVSFLSVISKGGLTAFGAMRDAQDGGGEYFDINNALKNAEESEQYFVTQYAENSKLAYGFKSTSYLSAEFCKTSLSQTYPSDFDALLSPESPPQFHAWFDEREYSQATSPPTSQYKVYYNLFAGNDTALGYLVYLTNPPESSEYSGMQNVIVDSGTLLQGESLDQTKDFTAPSGYKQLCLRINGKDYCGFGRVSTSFALNYLSDDYVKKQAYTLANSEETCVSGKPSISASNLANPNLQAGVEESLNPEIYTRGIVRVCATKNPGETTDSSRWSQVGNCGSENLLCWLDISSVKDALATQDFEGLTLEEIERLGMESILGEGYLTEEEVNSRLNDIRDLLGSINSRERLDEVLILADKLISGKTNEVAMFNYQKAQAMYLKGVAWDNYANYLLGNSIPSSVKNSNSGVGSESGNASSTDSGAVAENQLEGYKLSEYSLVDEQYMGQDAKRVYKGDSPLDVYLIGLRFVYVLDETDNNQDKLVGLVNNEGIITVKTNLEGVPTDLFFLNFNKGKVVGNSLYIKS